MSVERAHAAPFELRAQQIEQEYRQVDPPRRRELRWWLERNYHAIHLVVRDQAIKGGEKLTCLAVAFELPPAAMITDPMTLKPIIAFTGFTDDAIDLHLRKHADKILRHPIGRGRFRLEFVGLGGSLGLRADPQAARPRTDPRKIRSSDLRKIRSSNSESFPERFGDRASGSTKDRARAGSSSSSGSGTYASGSDDDPDRPTVEQVEHLAAYLDWHNQEFPRFNSIHGAPLRKVIRVGKREAGAVLEVLLDGWSVDDLKAATVELWQTEASPGDRFASYIAQTDRSLFILRDNITELQERALERRHRRASAAPEPEPHTLQEAIWARVRVRVTAWHFATWFEPCRLLDVRDDVVVIWAPSELHRDGIASMRLQEALEAAVADVVPGRRVVFRCGPDASTAEAVE